QSVVRRVPVEYADGRLDVAEIRFLVVHSSPLAPQAAVAYAAAQAKEAERITAHVRHVAARWFACAADGSCTCILRVIPSPANQVKYPHFTTCVSGLCHGITPLFLPAEFPGTPLALHHAALCLAKRVYRRGSEAIQASTATAQALPRPEAVSWPHPQAPVCRLCAGPRARPPAARVP